jgi:hypothetical protein
MAQEMGRLFFTHLFKHHDLPKNIVSNQDPKFTSKFWRALWKHMGLEFKMNVATPLWGKCEYETRIPRSGNLKSFGTPKNSELDCRGQNTSPWRFLYTVAKVLKFRCPKWPCMSHLDICSTSYGRKKGRESNWQFDSRPLKVWNQPDPGVCRWSATHCWKALKESYKFALDLIPIRGLSKKLWMSKVLGVQIETISGLHFGSPGKRAIWM